MAMQRVLTFELNKKKYASRPFDFEAFRLVNEKHLRGEVVGVSSCTIDAIYHMFEGTEATNDVLQQLSVGETVKMCGQVWSWYMDVLEAKND